MYPETEIVKSVEILPSQIENPAAGAVLVLGKKRGRWVRENTPGLIKPKKRRNPPPVELVASKLPPRESEDQKNAFEYYLGLGSERSPQKVADHYTIPARTVRYWADRFEWGARITKVENLPLIELAKRKLTNADLYSAEYLEATTKTFMIPDIDNPGHKKRNPDITASFAKDTIASVATMKKGIIDGESHQREMDRGPGGGTSGKNRGGFMVNFVIQR